MAQQDTPQNAAGSEESDEEILKELTEPEAKIEPQITPAPITQEPPRKIPKQIILAGALCAVIALLIFATYAFVHSESGERYLVKKMYPDTPAAPYEIMKTAMSSSIEFLSTGTPKDCSNIAKKEIPWYFPGAREVFAEDCAVTMAVAQVKPEWCPTVEDPAASFSMKKYCQDKIAMKAGKPQDCSEGEKDIRCFYIASDVAAMQTTDPKLCKTNGCRFALAIDTQDKTLCSGNTTCLAILGGDVNDCSTSDNQYDCMSIFAAIEKDVSLCENITVFTKIRQTKENCVGVVAFHNKDPSLCPNESCRLMLGDGRYLLAKEPYPDTYRMKLALLFFPY